MIARKSFMDKGFLSCESDVETKIFISAVVV